MTQTRVKNQARVAACKIAAATRPRDAHGHFLKKEPMKPKTIQLGNIHYHPEAGMIFDPLEVLDDDTLMIIELKPRED